MAVQVDGHCLFAIDRYRVELDAIDQRVPKVGGFGALVGMVQSVAQLRDFLAVVVGHIGLHKRWWRVDVLELRPNIDPAGFQFGHAVFDPIAGTQ